MMTLDPRRIPLTENSFRIYEDVDGRPFGAVFDEGFTIDHGFMGELWGFGGTIDDATSDLLRVTEEYNALYYKANIRFVPVFHGFKRE